MSNYSLLAHLEPDFQAKMYLLRQQIMAKGQIERFRAEEAMRREYVRADREDERQQQRYQMESELEQQNHYNRLTQLEESLRQSIVKSGFDSMVQFLQKEADEDTKKREHFYREIEAQSQTHNKTYEMLYGAVIQEVLAKKQHVREMEKLEKQQQFSQGERTMKFIEDYLLQVFKQQGEDAVKREIDRVCQELELMG